MEHVFDPNVRFLKSSGAKKPIPMTMITNVFDARELKANLDKENLEQFLRFREIDKQNMTQLLEQQLQETDSMTEGKSR